MADIIHVLGHINAEAEISQVSNDVFGFLVDRDLVQRNDFDLCTGLAQQGDYLSSDHAGAAGDKNAATVEMFQSISINHVISQRCNPTQRLAALP